MRTLSTWQSVVMLIGGVLMVIGAGCCAFLFQPQIFCFVYAVGAVLFVAMQLEQRYDGRDIVLRRLRRIMILACLFFILAAVSLVDTQYFLFQPLMSRVDYITYVYNKWVILLLAGAILEMYATHRINHELTKHDADKSK